MTHYPKRILVVEDNKLDMRLLKDILEGSGYKTLQAADGLEAIDLAFASLPDLILMDIQLPEISGLEVPVDSEATIALGEFRSLHLRHLPWDGTSARLSTAVATLTSQNRSRC
jgi:Response regulator receiver domain